MSDDSLLSFPCQFPIKIMGKNNDCFLNEIPSIVRKHFPAITENAILIRPSKAGNYLALSVTVLADSRKQLDALYQEVTQHQEVVMAL